MDVVRANCRFIIIYREMVNACWRFLSWYFSNNIPDLPERGSTIYCRDKGLPRVSARGSDSFSAFGPLDSELFHVISCWRDFCSLLRLPSTTDSFFAFTVAPNCVNSAYNARNTMLKSILSGFQGCCWRYVSIFIRFAVVASVGCLRFYATGSSALNCLIAFLIGWLLKVACHRVHSWDH